MQRVTNSALLRRRKAMAQQERRGEPETTGRVRGGGGFLPDIRGPSTQRAAAAAAQRRYARSPRHVEQQFQRGEQTPPQQQQPRQVIRQEPRGNRRQPRHPAKASDRRSRKDIEPARRAPQQERRRHPAAGQRGTVVVCVRKPKPFCNYRKHNRRLQRSVKSGAYANDRGLCVRVACASPRTAAGHSALTAAPPSLLRARVELPLQLPERISCRGRPHWQRALHLCRRAPTARRARLRGQVRRRRICRV